MRQIREGHIVATTYEPMTQAAAFKRFGVKGFVGIPASAKVTITHFNARTALVYVHDVLERVEYGWKESLIQATVPSDKAGGILLRNGIVSYTRDIHGTAYEVRRLARALSIIDSTEPDKMIAEVKPFRAALDLHYKGHKPLTQTTACKMYSLKRAVARELFQVPAKYTYAYRILQQVPRAKVPESLSSSPLEVFASGSGTHRHEGRPGVKVSSWSVNLDFLYDFVIGEDNKDGCMIAIRARIADADNRFVFNPDIMPFYAGTFQYDNQMEVVGIGSVRYEKAAAFYAPPYYDHHDYNAALDRLLEAVKP